MTEVLSQDEIEQLSMALPTDNPRRSFESTEEFEKYLLNWKYELEEPS